MENNLRIVTKYGELHYINATDLGIIFNRIADDFSDVENRYGEFSYDFFLPNVKQNAGVFDYVLQRGKKNIFKKNQDIPCQVYNNNNLILNGLLRLEGVSEKGYRCKFYSNFTALIDMLEERRLNELTFPLIEDWKYEESIIQHILADYKDSDETFYQYPLTFYSTTYCETAVFTGKTDAWGVPFRADNERQNYYYLINSMSTNRFNRHFYHQIPPAIYLIKIVQKVFEEAGFRLGGQFFENDNLKKILYIYAGEDDIYDKATGIESGSEELDLQVGRFLPDLRQSDFIQSVINMFNLYFIVEGDTVLFETYDTMFGDTGNPYDLTSKIDAKTVEFEYRPYNPSITFEAARNRQILGDTKVLSGSTFVNTNNLGYEEVFNYVGEEDNLRIRFAEPNIARRFLFNDYNKSGNLTNNGVKEIYQPLVSIQTPVDNDNRNFNRNDEDNHLFNNESSITFRGTGSMMYYYGISTDVHTYFNIYTGATENGTINRIPIPIVSPFQLRTFRDNINEVLTGTTNFNSKDIATASYLQGLWLMTQDSTRQTQYSLVFDDETFLHNTLFNQFHKIKHDRYENSEVLSADVRLTPYDWQQLTINRPVLYDGELYHIVAIEQYDIIEQSAVIKLLKTF